LRPTRANLRSLAALFAVAAASLSGCKAKQRYDSHGLRSIEIRMESEAAGGLYASAYDHVEYPAEVLIDGEEYDAVVSAAGSSTVRSPRKSFNVKLADGDFRGSEEFRLAGLVSDLTKVRPLIALEVFAAAGAPASWAEPAFVYLNDRVLGLYIAIERVDKDYFRNREIPLVRYISAEGDADFKPGFEGRIDSAFSGRPKPANLEVMVALYRTLAIPNDKEFESAVFRILDRTSVINYMVGTKILNHFDGFNKNLFYFEVAGSPLLHLAPWDFDLIWAIDRTGVPAPWYLNRLFSRMAALPSVSTEIDGKVAILVADSLSESAILSRVEFWKTRMAEAYAHDPFLGKSGKSIDEEVAKLIRAIGLWYDRFDARN
jgi:spore coat protein H